MTSSDGDDARRWRTCQIEAPFHAESPTFVRLLAEKTFDGLLHFRHPSHPTNKNNFVDGAFVHPGVLDALLARV